MTTVDALMACIVILAVSSFTVIWQERKCRTPKKWTVKK